MPGLRLAVAEDFTSWMCVRSATTCWPRSQRRPESYHQKVLSGPSADGEDVASIHDRVVFKQADLDKHLHYDQFARKSLMDHFYDNDATLDSVASGEALERGDFVDLPLRPNFAAAAAKYRFKCAAMETPGHSDHDHQSDHHGGGKRPLEHTYLLENLPPSQQLHFAID